MKRKPNLSFVLGLLLLLLGAWNTAKADGLSYTWLDDLSGASDWTATYFPLDQGQIAADLGLTEDQLFAAGGSSVIIYSVKQDGTQAAPNSSWASADGNNGDWHNADGHSLGGWTGTPSFYHVVNYADFTIGVGQNPNAGLAYGQSFAFKLVVEYTPSGGTPTSTTLDITYKITYQKAYEAAVAAAQAALASSDYADITGTPRTALEALLAATVDDTENAYRTQAEQINTALEAFMAGYTVADAGSYTLKDSPQHTTFACTYLDIDNDAIAAALGLSTEGFLEAYKADNSGEVTLCTYDTDGKLYTASNDAGENGNNGYWLNRDGKRAGFSAGYIYFVYDSTGRIGIGQMRISESGKDHVEAGDVCNFSVVFKYESRLAVVSVTFKATAFLLLSEVMATAKETISGMTINYDTTALQAAIARGETVTEATDDDEVLDIINAINTALADYQTALAGVNSFQTYITAAKAERAANAYPGSEAFDTAIAAAETFYTQLQENPSLSIAEAADALNAAREAYYNSQYTIAPVQQTISYVDLSLNGSEKYVLRVDGRPYYGTEIQMRPDKLRGYEGWSESEIEATFKRAADDGFNTLSIPLFWSEVEPEKNHFDWTILDRYLGWCKKYGVKAEILWFSWSSGGRVQWLWNGTGGKYQLRTPDYVCSQAGTSEFNMLRTEWEYSLDWRDQNLINREIYVLGRVMEHIALWDANNEKPHTVIGVQLGNEARGHGGNSATAAEIINYYHQVGAAVKQSKYVTWTRLNCVSYETSGRTSANESKRNNGGTNIDFVGIDVYGTSAGSVKGDLSGQLGTNGKNYRMIMEIDAKDSWSPVYQMAALAGNKAFDYYNMGPVDGNGLYANSGHVLTERTHITLTRQRNKILNLANQDIALRAHGNGLYVYNYSAQNSNTESGLDGIVFAPDANNTQAIAVRHSSSQIALLSTAGGTFTIPASMTVTSAQRGYFDQNNRWVSEGDVTVSGSQIAMPETSCVLLTLDGVQPTDGLVTWGDGTASTWTAPTGGPYYSGSEVILTGVTVTLGNIDDAATTWSYHSGNAGLLPTQMPSTDGTAGTLVTGFTETAPFGTLPTHGCYLKIEASETGTLSIGCKPSTDAAQLLVFVTMDAADIASAKIISTIWDASYNFDVEAGKTYYFFQLAKTGLLTSYRFTLKSLSFLKEGQKPIKVFTIGDSTMAQKSSATERGWGMLLPTFVDQSVVTVSNQAVDGRSTKSFIDEGRWTTVVNQLAEGDYVLIQFGHNDEKTDASLHTEPQTTYKENLTKFVSETLSKGANPVLLTPIVRRIFGSDGNIVNEHEAYAEAMRQLAEELNVPLIDMTLLSSQYENIAGIQGSRALHEYFPGSEIDNTHLCQFGAYITARCVAEQIVQDDRIAIALNESPAALDGAYSSTLDYAQHAFLAAYPEAEAAASLTELDADVRALRNEARQAISEGDDATFALVNPDFAEGFCWYNAVQATRPMGWTISYTGGINIKASTAAKTDSQGETVIPSGQEHLQFWGLSATATLSQTVTGLSTGTYELSATICIGGTLTATLFAGEGQTAVTASGRTSVVADVTDGTLTFGVSIADASGATIDMDDFTLTKVSDTATGIGAVEEPGMKNDAVYDLQGRRVTAPQRGLYIIGGKKVLVK